MGNLSLVVDFQEKYAALCKILACNISGSYGECDFHLLLHVFNDCKVLSNPSSTTHVSSTKLIE